MVINILKWKWKSLSHIWLLATHELYSPWNSPGQNTGVGSLSLLQGIFPTQGSNPGLPHCKWILYQLNHEGNWRILEWVAYPFSCGFSWPRNQTRVSCIAGGFFSNWATIGFLTNVRSWAKLLIWYTNWKLQTFVCDKMKFACSVSSCTFSRQSQVSLWGTGLEGLKYPRFCSMVFSGKGFAQRMTLRKTPWVLIVADTGRSALQVAFHWILTSTL